MAVESPCAFHCRAMRYELVPLMAASVLGPARAGPGPPRPEARRWRPGPRRRTAPPHLIKYGSIRQCSAAVQAQRCYSRLVPSWWRMAGAVLLLRASRRRTANASLTSWRMVASSAQRKAATSLLVAS
jgi:hypothetical protein